MNSKYCSAKQAANELGISITSLYAYVSRGLVRSEQTSGNKRDRHYLREDIEQLKLKKTLKRSPEKIVQSALHWGSPILDSSISCIVDNNLCYRGHSIQSLCTNQSFEHVITLLWQDDLYAITNWSTLGTELHQQLNFTEFNRQHGHMPFIHKAQLTLIQLAYKDAQGCFIHAANVTNIGTKILLALTSLATNIKTKSDLVTALQYAWQIDDTAKNIINSALIVCADHELNASAFTGRCIASTRANPYQTVNGALAAFSGPKHGGTLKNIRHFWDGLIHADNISLFIAERLESNEPIVGFHHPLYPNGDPRANILLQQLYRYCPNSPQLKMLKALCNIMQTHQQYPVIDFAIVALEKILKLPDEAATILFIIGRTAGWIAHALEQYETDQLIRPRVRYCGRTL